ncbi:TUTLB-like protein, partial [Mya arenaria]
MALTRIPKTVLTSPGKRPHTPSNLQLNQKATVDTIYIEWTPGFDGGLPQTFHVEFMEVGFSVWRDKGVIAGYTNHTIAGLNPNTLYEIKVYSTNDHGRSTASEAITVTTLKMPETLETGLVIPAAVGGGILTVATVIVVLVILRRKSPGHCIFLRKRDVQDEQSVSGTDHPGYNEEQTYKRVFMTTAESKMEQIDPTTRMCIPRWMGQVQNPMYTTRMIRKRIPFK